MLPLAMTKAGDKNIITKVNGKEEVKTHLANLGFVVGAEVSVVSEIDGNIIVEVKGSRVAIGKDLATKILV